MSQRDKRPVPWLHVLKTPSDSILWLRAREEGQVCLNGLFSSFFFFFSNCKGKESRNLLFPMGDWTKKEESILAMLTSPVIFSGIFLQTDNWKLFCFEVLNCQGRQKTIIQTLRQHSKSSQRSQNVKIWSSLPIESIGEKELKSTEEAGNEVFR